MALGRGRGAGENAPDVIANPLVQGLKGDLLRAETKMSELSMRVGPNHPQFQQQHPLPDPLEPVEALAERLDELRQDTTVPYVTPMHSTEIVHTGDQLRVVDRCAASPYFSRPGRPRLAADYQHQHRR